MLRRIAQLFLSATAVYLAAEILPGVTLDGFTSAIWAALVLALLNTFLKPVLQILSLPVTILTFGLFLIIINTIIVMLCSEILDGFEVSGFFQGILFSIILTIITSLLNWLFKPTEK
ncbi:MAG: phage holin family protein [Bacteroidales bacterium]|nr:phage holin family protein [Bacteroidales bacterium]MDD4820988.1 phage holin family protein [Bacteroidales bacterium]